MHLGLRHIHARKRLAKGLEPFPARGTAKRYFDYFMFGIGLVQPIALLPQITRIFVEHRTDGVSLSTWLMLTFFNMLWATYGVVHKGKPLIFAYTIIAVLDAVIVVGLLVYG